MKRLKWIVLLAVLVLATSVSADFIVEEHVAGEKVVRDTNTNLYWYWNLKDFAWSTYEVQIDAISALGDYGGAGINDWHMATKDEITGLFENELSVFAGYDPTGQEIIEVSFNPSSQVYDMTGGVGGFLEYRDTTFRGRYSSVVAGGTPSHHYAEWVHYWTGAPENYKDDHFESSLDGVELDSYRAADMGVWIAGSAVAPVPVPGAALLGFVGMATSSLVLRKRRKERAGVAS